MVGVFEKALALREDESRSLKTLLAKKDREIKSITMQLQQAIERDRNSRDELVALEKKNAALKEETRQKGDQQINSLSVLFQLEAARKEIAELKAEMEVATFHDDAGNPVTESEKLVFPHSSPKSPRREEELTTKLEAAHKEIEVLQSGRSHFRAPHA